MTATVRIPLAAAPGRARRAFVVRGDLASPTGYGHATRALAALLPPGMERYGVDLHPDFASERMPFPGEVVGDDVVETLCRQPDVDVFVLNYTTPDGFRYFPGATNIGSFYWETSAVPFQQPWREKIAAMDYMWAPTDYVRTLIHNAGYSRPIFIVTWPHAPEAGHPAAVNDLGVSYVEAGRTVAPVTLEQLGARGRPLFLCVASMAPRKGLPVMLTEWRDHVTAGGDGILLLKLRFIHNSRLGPTPEAHMARMLDEAGFGADAAVRVAYIPEDLATAQMEGLYRRADAYVTASYGEGFGGPVVEALLAGTPVIAPRHTGLADLLPEGYPLVFGTDPLHVGLRGNPPVYPHAASWLVPRRGEIQRALDRFCAFGPAEAAAAAAMGKRGVENFCSPTRVRAQLDAFWSAVGAAFAD